MKIEESPYQFNGSSPIDKLRRSQNLQSPDISLDDLDLSFLDLLTSIASDVLPTQTEQDAKASRLSNTKKKETASEDSAVDSTNVRPIQSAYKANASRDTDAEFYTRVDKEMSLLKTELTTEDTQYLKQAVIPGLPILLGSVPFQSIFPATPSGEISYKGFGVSPKLAELIEKGYKTGRPIRVELDNQSALVLKIRDGQVSAEFVSADKGAVLMMQQELTDLRNKMALKNLPVGTLESKYQQADSSSYQHDQSSARDED